MGNKTLAAQAVRENYDRILGFILECAESVDQPKFLFNLELVAEELIVNVLSYAYPGQPGEVRVTCALDEAGRTFRLVIADRGVAFDPLSAKQPDIAAPIEDRKIGGLGLFMVKKLTQSQRYERIDGENRLTVDMQY